MKSVFTRNLMRWNKSSNTRHMPWKGEKDPYKIWLSEIILQQTRVEQGWKYYEKFVTSFPTIHHLAKGTDKKIFKLWEGLGYYSRCKNLIQTAKRISAEYKGFFPSTYEEIKELKGVGPYTASAIASFAFNATKAVVDGNVQRVIARYFGIATPVDTREGKRLYNELAYELLDKRHPAIYNQAIMDFGATICKPQNPLCDQCVQRKDCVALQVNLVHTLPVKEKAFQKKNRWLYYFIIETEQKVYIRKRIEKDIWQNLHEFVLFEADGPVNTPFYEHEFLKKLFKGQFYEVNSISKLYKQQLTHRNIHGQFIQVSVKKAPRSLSSHQLICKANLKQYAFPKLINKYMEEKSSFFQ